MSESVATPILRRGCQLIALSDIVIGGLGILGGISGATQSSNLSSNHIVILAFGIFVNLLVLAFGIVLLIGGRNGRQNFILAWYIPNVISVVIVVLTGVGLSFFMVGYNGTLIGIVTGGLIFIRSLEIWIISELWIALKQNQLINSDC